MHRRLCLISFVTAGVIDIDAMTTIYTETAIQPAVSPPDDIPDSQVFITFASRDGFSIKVPEGWARRDGPHETVFSDRYNRIALDARDLPQTLDLAYAKSALVPEIEAQGRAVKITGVKEVALKNSEPNDVTGKQVRRENERFCYAKGGRLVALGPTGVLWQMRKRAESLSFAIRQF